MHDVVVSGGQQLVWDVTGTSCDVVVSPLSAEAPSVRMSRQQLQRSHTGSLGSLETASLSSAVPPAVAV